MVAVSELADFDKQAQAMLSAAADKTRFQVQCMQGSVLLRASDNSKTITHKVVDASNSKRVEKVIRWMTSHMVDVE